MDLKTSYQISPLLMDLGYEQISTLDQETTDGEGWEFYSTGQIQNATVFENKISGRVGNFTEEYHVEIVFIDDEIRSSCNCNHTGQICKHVLALLYGWVNDGEGFINVGDSLQELENYNRDRLLEIITNVIRHDPKNIERFLYSEPSFDEIDYELSGLYND